MRGFIGLAVVCAVVALFLFVAPAGADEKEKTKKIDVDKVPKKVMAAVKARFPKAKITSVEKETTDGKVMYDIELTQKGRKYEMDILEDGTVLEVEKEVFLKDAPEALTKAVKAKYPRAKIKVIMEVNKVKDKKETPDHYEVTLQEEGKKEFEVLVSLDGKIKTEGEKK